MRRSERPLLAPGEEDAIATLILLRARADSALAGPGAHVLEFSVGYDPTPEFHAILLVQPADAVGTKVHEETKRAIDRSLMRHTGQRGAVVQEKRGYIRP